MENVKPAVDRASILALLEDTFRRRIRKPPKRALVWVLLVLAAGALACRLFQSPTPTEPAVAETVPPIDFGGSPTPLPPTETLEPSSVPPTVTASPSATLSQPTATPSSGSPESSADPFARTESGDPAAVWSFSLHMHSTAIGWAVLQERGDSPTRRVLRTTDGGETWHDLTPVEPPSGITQAFFLDGDHAWVVQPEGQGAVVWMTGDGGGSWNPGEPLDLFDPWSVTLTFLDAQNGWLFSGEPLGMHKVPTTVYRSTDGSTTWETLYADTPGNEGPLFSGYKTDFVFRDASTGWAAVGSPYILPEIVTTSDGGRSWEHQFLPPPGSFAESDVGDCEPLSAPFVFPSQTVKLLARCWVIGEDEPQRYVYLSADGGQTWRTSLVPGTEGAVEFVNPRVGLADSRTADDEDSSELYRTNDGGETWDLIRQMNWWTDQLDFVNDQEGWAVARAGGAMALVHTLNSGRTWELLQPVIVP